jgi:hypothetical protein
VFLSSSLLCTFVGGAVFCAVALSLSSVIWCETGQFTIADSADGKEVNFGTWRYNSFSYYQDVNTGDVWKIEGCSSYPDGIEKDTAWKAAQAFSIIAPVWGTFAACPVMMSGKNPSMAKAAGMLLMLASLFQGLTLLLWTSYICDAATNPFFDGLLSSGQSLTEDHCALGRSAIVSICATCLFFVGGAIALAMPVDADADDPQPE